jgi:hypothetical protein
MARIHLYPGIHKEREKERKRGQINKFNLGFNMRNE